MAYISSNLPRIKGANNGTRSFHACWSMALNQPMGQVGCARVSYVVSLRTSNIISSTLITHFGVGVGTKLELTIYICLNLFNTGDQLGEKVSLSLDVPTMGEDKERLALFRAKSFLPLTELALDFNLVFSI